MSTLVDKLLEIDSIIHAEGGLSFINVRFFLQDVERLAAEGHPQAVQFSKELDNVLKVIKAAGEGK
jgi:hypothetical protein